MSNTPDTCCPDCGADRSALLAELADAEKRAAESNAAVEATWAEVRVFLEQRMEAGQDITPVLEALEREGIDVADLLIG
ncbi:hypothetical protein ACIQHU_39360 [Streptomyces tendae]|uniref:hypothetical protein n=1 Tax=Streptomyces tendae TaxID=1932 RepID=UPI0037F967B8